MADRIRLLPEPVANQIAAGEVVNRPSSAVKELMENAVDAGATSITVDFRDGGKAMVKVVDDGCGMSPIDARLAFDRHATSKIKNVEDIYALTTFGFRGEALASISSVAEVELRTRQHGEELGTKVELAGGKFVCQEPINTPVGSQFIIRNLFYNVPARRRFLDKSTTEARHIVAEYQRVALCHPEISFALYENESLLSKLPPGTLRQRVVGVIGKNIGKNLLDVHTDTSIVKVEGFVGRPSAAKQNNREQFLFVNGRYFKSGYFHKAVTSAYEKLIPSNTQPCYFLYLTIEQDRIDVNVHPQKTEVKFSDGSDIWQIINAAVRESLAKSGAVPPMDFELDESVEIPVFRGGVTYSSPRISANPDFNPFAAENARGDDDERLYIEELEEYLQGREPFGASDHRGVFSALGANESSASASSASISGAFASALDAREISIASVSMGGQTRIFDTGTNTITNTGFDTGGNFPSSEGGLLPVGDRYVAARWGDGVAIVDLRRAWEAVLYDRYILMPVRNVDGQQLLFPELLELGTEDALLLGRHENDFAAFGFDIAWEDDHTIRIEGIPADLTSSPAEQLIGQLLETLREQTQLLPEMRRQRLAAALAGSAARSRTKTRPKTGASPRQTAVQTTMQTTAQIAALLEELAGCSNPSFTPSGLPVMTSLSQADIRKLIG